MKAHRSRFPLAQGVKCDAEVVLCFRPIQRPALAGEFLKRCLVGLYGLFKALRVVFQFAEDSKSVAKIALHRGPIEQPRARVCSLSDA